ncbi:MAG TPA: DNA-binding response regulator, partial [Gammaproteobacteria bacterium]|nr:DNA-binding response regulator [Gammaproteobacteria bacterium]
MKQQPVRRVLVVDDEPAVRGMLTASLEMAGFKVVEAESASSALHEIANS